MKLARHVAATLVLLLCSIASAQISAGKWSPDRLSIGIAHVGSTVEASTRLFIDQSDDVDVQPTVTAPPFVRVTGTKIGTQEYGRGNLWRYCDLSLTIDTAQAGEFSAPMQLVIDGKTHELPISVTVRPRAADQSRVLIVQTPFKNTSGDDHYFEAWRKLVSEANLDVDYWNTIPEQSALHDRDLSTYKVILLAEEALLDLDPPDIDRINRYVEGGGRAVIGANYFFRGSVEKANDILKPHGIEIADAEPPTDGNRETMGAGEIVAGEKFTDGIRQLNFFRASPIMIKDPALAKALVKSTQFEDSAVLAVARHGKGEFIAIGQSMWWTWIGKEAPEGSDNAKLMQHLLTK